MAVPSVSAMSPIVGHTGGQTLVSLEGAGFRVPSAGVADETGIVPEPAPTVSVTFGGVAARAVMSVSSALVYVLTPIHDPGAVDVVVTNLDDDGVPIPGESVTVAAGFRFQRPDLTVESDLARVIRTLIRELRRQITPNVSWPQSTDFDKDTGDQESTTELPEFPGLILNDVALPANPFYATREPVEHENEDGTIGEHAPPTTVDIVITLVGVSDSSNELVNLAAATRRFFRKNPYLSMARDPEDATRGEVQYELDWGETDQKFTISSNKDNVRSFVGAAVIRGFDIEGMAGLALGGPGDDSGDDHESTVDVTVVADSVVLEPTSIKAIV